MAGSIAKARDVLHWWYLASAEPCMHKQVAEGHLRAGSMIQRQLCSSLFGDGKVTETLDTMKSDL